MCILVLIKVLNAQVNGDIFCLLPCGRAAYGLIERPNDFASYLLAIAICNLLLYFAFYIIMKVCVCAYIHCSHTGFRAELGVQSLFCICVKLRSGERIQCLALVCILFTAVVWGFALYFFFQGLSTWQVSNSEMHTHMVTWSSKCFKLLHDTALLRCVLRKLQPSLASTTGTASCFHSLMTMIFGTSCPPLLCLDPFWYHHVYLHFAIHL